MSWEVEVVGVQHYRSAHFEPRVDLFLWQGFAMGRGEHDGGVSHVVDSEGGAIFYLLDEGLKVFGKSDGAGKEVDGSRDRTTVVNAIG